MNRKIGMIGSMINVITVLCFAICMIIPFDFGSYFVCILLAISFIMMIAAFKSECSKEREAAANSALVFSGIYAVLVMIVYFAQTTTIRLQNLSTEANSLLNFSEAGLFFNYDLLGYGLMALATFFIALTIQPKCRRDKWLKGLLMVHGVFFISCLIMPMTGIFISKSAGSSAAGVIALEIWCAYFIPIGILSFLHFKGDKKRF